MPLTLWINSNVFCHWTKLLCYSKVFFLFYCQRTENAIQGVGYSHFIVMYTYCQKTIIRSLSYNSVSSHKMKVFTLLLMVLVSVKYVVTLMLPPNLTRISSREKNFHNFLALLMLKIKYTFDNWWNTTCVRCFYRKQLSCKHWDVLCPPPWLIVSERWQSLRLLSLDFLKIKINENFTVHILWGGTFCWKR